MRLSMTENNKCEEDRFKYSTLIYKQITGLR